MITRSFTCAFCGKNEDQVKKIIAGPSLFICNECVDVCNEILTDDGYYSYPPVMGDGSKPLIKPEVKLKFKADNPWASDGWAPATIERTAQSTKARYLLSCVPDTQWQKHFFETWREKTKDRHPKPELRFDGSTVIVITRASDDSWYGKAIEECMNQANYLKGTDSNVTNIKTKDYLH
jgi:hypothetical protein